MRKIKETDDRLNEKDAIRSVKFIDNIFKRNNVMYWLDYGTLLGVIRDKKFIPWDTDIEFYMFYRDMSDVHKVLQDIKKEGFGLLVHDITNPRRGATIEDRKGYIHMSFGWFKYRPFISSFFYYLPSFLRKKIMKFTHKFYSNSTNKKIRPYEGKERVSHKFSCVVREFLPIFFCGRIKDVDFYDFTVSVPGKSEDLLYFRYGKDWRIPKKEYESYTV